MQDKAQKVKDYFNETDNYLKKNPEIALRSSLIKKNLPDLNNKNILDIGCGNGDITLPYIKNNNITFLDFSEKMLEIVRKKIPNEYRQNAQFLNIDLNQLSGDKKYDYLFVIGVLAHVNSIELTFSKFVELLDSDGTIIVQFTNRTNIISILTTFIFEIKYMFRKKPPFKVNYTSLHNIKKELQKSKLAYYTKVAFWPASLPGFGMFPEGVRSFIYKLLNGKILRPLGSEVLLFVSLAKE